MDSELQNLLTGYYAQSEPQQLSTNDLYTMVEQAMAAIAPLLSEDMMPGMKGDQSTSDFLRYLPKFEMSEKVGELSTPESQNEARETFGRYLNAVIASDPGLPGKIEYINSFTTGKVADTASISEILSNLTFLKILSFVITQFSPSGSGFLFEAFLAALLQGTQMTEREQGGALPIDDYREMVDPETGEGGVPVSLKLLSPGTTVEGSIYNIIDFLRRSPVALEYGGIKYVVAIKTTDNKLEFYKFDIKPEDFFYWISPKFFKWDLIAQAMQQYQQPQDLQEQQEQEADPESQFQEFKEFWASIAPSWGQEITAEEISLPIADFMKKTFRFKMLPQRKEGIIAIASGDAGSGAWENLSSTVGTSDDFGSEALQQALQQYQADPAAWSIVKNLLTKRRVSALKYTEKVSADHPHSYYAIATYLKAEATQDPSALTKDQDVASMISTLNELAKNGDLETWGNMLIGPPAGGKPDTSRLKDTQFAIQQKFLRSGGGVRMGTIITDPEQIQQTLTLYSERLRDMVIPIYTSLGELTEAVNRYYIEGDMLAGERAASHARELSKHTDNLQQAPQEVAAAAKE